MKAPRGGFTLIEVVVIIAVLSILAAMAVPYAAQLIDRSKTEATRTEMETLYNAIMGDPKIPTGGFFGDVGRLPNNLDQIYNRTAPPLPAPPAGPPGGGFLGVKVGWYGPYVNTGYTATGYRTDAWGTAYAYSPATGQIRSGGPDRFVGNADDIVYPSNPLTVATGRLTVNLFVWDNNSGAFVTNPQTTSGFPQMTSTVAFYYSNNGTQTTWSVAIPPSTGGGPYPFTGNPVHPGLHAVWAQCRLSLSNTTVSGQAVTYVPGGNQQTTLNLYLR
jgi:prepilin-type N-terminal cleavage/methylation domain-containing protein